MTVTPVCRFTDDAGSFRVEHPDRVSYLYFPLANEAGMMSAVTPSLGGDAKTGQNTFLLAPASAETLHDARSTRNFWLYGDRFGRYSVTGASARQRARLFDPDNPDEVTLEGGLLWQTVTRKNRELGLSAAVTSFVPADGPAVELHKVTLRCTGKEPLLAKPYVAVPLYARSADNLRDHRHVTALLHRAVLTRYGVSLHPTLTFDERGHKRNTVTYGVFAADGHGRPPIAGCLSAEDFIGEGGSFDNPQMVGQTLPLTAGATLDGYETVAALQFPDLILHPGESRTYLFALAADGEGDAESLCVPYLTEAAFDAALTRTKAYWQARASVTCRTGDPQFDGFMRWVAAQPTLRRLYGCSFLPHHDYGRGGRGWRDLWQDCLALLMMEPADTRELLLNNFGGVRMDGTNATVIGRKPGEFIADRNKIARVWMDHGAWPLLTTRAYLDRTGDTAFLFERCPYFKDALVCRARQRDPSFREEDGCRQLTADGAVYEGTVLEHLLLQNLVAFYNVGEHNLLRLDGADWNDALDMAADRGESVAFSCLYYANLKDLALLLERLEAAGHTTVTLAEDLALLLGGDYDDAAAKQAVLTAYYATCTGRVSGRTGAFAVRELIRDLRDKAAFMHRHLQETQWVSDGQGHRWLNSYYDNHGRAVEGVIDGQVRMMLTGQVYAVMSGLADDTQVADIVRAADAYLFDPACGGYRLNTDFRELKDDLGRQFGFAFGHKENGAVFSHMAVMFASALYRRGFAREGYKALSALYRQSSDFAVSRIYPGIPEYFDPKGRGMYHYLTGSASWYLMTVLEEMFGLSADNGDLVLCPRLMREQFDSEGNASVTAPFGGRMLTVIYRNPQKLEYGTYTVSAVTLDGTPLEDTAPLERLTAGMFRVPAAVLAAASSDTPHTLTVLLS